jgi:hypothetical protein
MKVNSEKGIINEGVLRGDVTEKEGGEEWVEIVLNFGFFLVLQGFFGCVVSLSSFGIFVSLGFLGFSSFSWFFSVFLVSLVSGFSRFSRFFQFYLFNLLPFDSLS